MRLLAANQDDNGVGYDQVLRSGLLEVTLESLTNNRKDPSLLRWSCRMYAIFAVELELHHIETLIKHSLSLIDVVAVGRYSSEGAAREWSTVVDISIPLSSFKLVSLSLSRISSI